MRAWIEGLDDERDVHFHSAQKDDLDAIATWCKDANAAGLGEGPDGKLAMRCDGFTIMAWCNAQGITWGEFFRDPKIQVRFLDDPANAAFRVWKGRI